jgi:YesN/AraC family two-component response regulator
LQKKIIRTLIVDDEKLVRKGLISVMPWEQYGFSVAGEAANGEKAMEFIKENDVDLIFVDLAMPVLSGLELMRRIRVEFPRIFIVVITCHQDFEYIQEALRLGAIDYIVKTQMEKETMESVLERISVRVHNEWADIAAGTFIENADTHFKININPDVRHKFSNEIINSILEAVKYVCTNLDDEISQDTVAKKVNMSRGYFSQCFKDVTGRFFGEFVREMKINRAKELLLQTNRPIYWIAEQLGFLDEKYFSRFFKEHMGVLPSEYRITNRV